MVVVVVVHWLLQLEMFKLPLEPCLVKSLRWVVWWVMHAFAFLLVCCSSMAHHLGGRVCVVTTTPGCLDSEQDHPKA